MRFFLILLYPFFLAFSPLNYAWEAAVERYWRLDHRTRTHLDELGSFASKFAHAEAIPPQDALLLDEILQEFSLLQKELGLFQQGLRRAHLSRYHLPGVSTPYDKEAHLNPAALSMDTYVETLLGANLDLLGYELLRFYHIAFLHQKAIRSRMEEQNGLFSAIENRFMKQSFRVRFAKSLLILEEMQESGDFFRKSLPLWAHALIKRLDTPLCARMKKEASFWGQISGFFSEFLAKFKIRIWKTLNQTEYLISKWFGNAAGAINVQKFLPSISIKDLEALKKELQPGDILVEKTAGAITDAIIPGHFGHVALYIGTPEQLGGISWEGRPLNQHPALRPYLEELQKGHTVLESIRPGVQFVDISEWKITDLAVLRPISPKEIPPAIIRSMIYPETAYDFRFDVNTRNIIVCSELPYQVFHKLKFPTRPQAGRISISPDDVAVYAIRNPDQLRLTHFFHKTARVMPEDAFPLYRQLVEKNFRAQE